MAFPAADMGFCDITLAFLAGCFDSNLFPNERERAVDRANQDHMFTGIGLKDPKHRAGDAQVWGPFFRYRRSIQQPAFFPVPTPIVITKKIFTFFASRVAHGRDYSMALSIQLGESPKTPRKEVFSMLRS